jgi:DNA-binding LacI/PurR family transcriptional regulator
MNESKPAVTRAMKYVEAGIESGKWTKGGIIPSLRVLADSAGVSRNTMWKAVGALDHKGLLTVVPKGRILIGSARYKPFPSSVSSLWLEKQSAFVDDILSGQFKNHQDFPSLKELCVSYGISYQTLHRILSSLVETGFIKRAGKKFALSMIQTRYSYRQTVVILSTTFGSVLSYSDESFSRQKIMFDAIEKECARLGLKVRFLLLDQQEHRENLRMIGSLKHDKTITGYIVNLFDPEPVDWADRMVGYIRLLVSYGKPVSVLDHMAILPDPLIRYPAQLRIFRIGSRTGGRLAAKLLLGNGHRKIVFISLWHKYVWSIDRLNGMIDIFRKAGLSENITVLTTPFTRSIRSDFFKKALADETITAWVCSGDRIALKALEFLSKVKKDVPGRLTVLGFDNMLSSFEKRLSTIDFNMEAVGYRMLKYVLYPSGEFRTTQSKPIEIEPLLIERGTSGPVPGSIRN